MNDPYTRRAGRRAQPNKSATALRWLTIGIGALALCWLSVQWYTKLARPYNEYWHNAAVEYNASYTYLHGEQSFCGDAEVQRKFRLQLKSHYDECDRAQRIVSSYPAWVAFGRLLDDFEFCPGGTCIRFEFSALNTLGLLFILFTVVLVMIMVAFIIFTCRWMYTSVAGKHDLPFGAQQPILFAHGAMKTLAPACDYPPHTHAYDFNAQRRDKNE